MTSDINQLFFVIYRASSVKFDFFCVPIFKLDLRSTFKNSLLRIICILEVQFL